MRTWRTAVEDYIQLRRSLGFKLCDAKVALLHFASFLEASGASHLTIALALQWAQQDPAARPAAQFRPRICAALERAGPAHRGAAVGLAPAPPRPPAAVPLQ